MHRPNCPQTIPPQPLPGQSSLTEKTYYCAQCGSIIKEYTPFKKVSELVPAASLGVGIVSATIGLISLLNGEVPDVPLPPVDGGA